MRRDLSASTDPTSTPSPLSTSRRNGKPNAKPRICSAARPTRRRACGNSTPGARCNGSNSAAIWRSPTGRPKRLSPRARKKVLVVTGGPGTGKTTIIKSILDVLGVLKGEGLLAAPTGRAAKRLSETTGHEAKTLHRLLALRPGAEHHAGRITVDPDVFIVDEASMVDLTLMAAILRSLAPHTHLVLVGDVDQLPSVGAGDVLRDIIRSERFRVVTLNEIFRQDAESLIVANAHRILAGGDLSLPDKGDDADFHFIVRDNPAGAVGTIVDLVADRLPARFGLDPVRDIVVLSPMHKGDTGVKKLNEALQQRLNPHGPAVERGGAVFRAGDRVLQTANDYDREIFNGDLGVIVHADPAERRLVVDFDGRRVTVEGAELGDLAPAYAISVHKSQGSEYPAVVIALSTYHFVMLKRNLLYTAITRAKKLVVIVGSRRALERAIANNEVGRRYGLLRERLARTGRGAL
ncbi:MAG: AAA family ATPase [Deltaproteobacteria bacterium]|nr:AAA family ATPase [Deltaproteobacteria bacterium]